MADRLTVKAAAKINLALDVTGRLPNGYHAIESVFQTVGLYDEVTAELTESGISVDCSQPAELAAADPIPCDERNIAYKAAKLFTEKTGLKTGCSIHIDKRIPSQAGMGGGSADAAAVLYCLDKLTGTGLSTAALAEMGAALGADVPFFFFGGTAYVSGIGEKITPAGDYSGRVLVIAKGTEGVSTAEAYRLIDSLAEPAHPDAAGLHRALKNAPDTACKYFGNLFEQAIQLEEVKAIRAGMLRSGAHAACMTGSGSAVFGLFDTQEQAEKCALSLRDQGYFAQTCLTVNSSFIEA